MKKKAGFTLIELLFVLAILGILVTSSILFYQQRNHNQKIEELVIQMGRWAQAGTEYYTRNKNWPADVKVLMDQGYISKNAENHNPFCESNPFDGDCYSLSSDGQLLMITAKIIGSDAVRKAIAARLPYATATAKSVISTVNVSLLKKIKELPDVVLIDTRSFQIGPVKDNRFWINLIMDEKNPEPHNSNIYVSSTTGITNLGPIPNCAAYTGSDYTLKTFPVLSGFTARTSSNDAARRVQQAAFSLLEVYTNIAPNGLNVGLRARPQRTFFNYWSCVWGGYPHNPDCLPSNMVSELVSEIVVRGTVFLVCCKNKTHCEPPTDMVATQKMSADVAPEVRF